MSTGDFHTHTTEVVEVEDFDGVLTLEDIIPEDCGYEYGSVPGIND